MEFGEIRAYIGTIVEVDKMNVKVNILGAKTQSIPYAHHNNAFKKTFVPLKVGMQVLVLGVGDVKFVICELPTKDGSIDSKDKEMMIYSDGTKISYDTSNSTLEIESSANININCKNANITSEKVCIQSGSVDIGDIGGGGVVTTQCICAYTGSPHPQGSMKVKAGL